MSINIQRGCQGKKQSLGYVLKKSRREDVDIFRMCFELSFIDGRNVGVYLLKQYTEYQSLNFRGVGEINFSLSLIIRAMKRLLVVNNVNQKEYGEKGKEGKGRGHKEVIIINMMLCAMRADKDTDRQVVQMNVDGQEKLSRRL